MPDSEEDDDSHTTEEELKGFAVAASTLERLGLMDESMRRGFKGCQTEMRLAKQSSLRQTSVADHFRKVCGALSLPAYSRCSHTFDADQGV